MVNSRTDFFCNFVSFLRPDAYAYYGIYIDSIFKLLKPGAAGDDMSTTGTYTFKDEPISADCTIDSCISFIKNCQNNNQQSHKIRGPYLAEMLLYRRLEEEGFDPVSYLGMVFQLFDTLRIFQRI